MNLRTFAKTGLALAIALLSVSLLALLPEASAEGVGCSSWYRYAEKGGPVDEEYGTKCIATVNEGGHTLCIGYEEYTHNHYNDGENGSSTTKGSDCAIG